MTEPTIQELPKKKLSASTLLIAFLIPLVQTIVGPALLIPMLGSLAMFWLLKKYLPEPKKALAPALAIHAYFMIPTYRDAFQSGAIEGFLLATLQLPIGMAWLYWKTNYWSIGYLLLPRCFDLYYGLMFAFTVHKMGSLEQKQEFAVFILIGVAVVILIRLLIEVYRVRNPKSKD
jgi:hypothetical protein